jgi:S1-C subfamily serine protease
MGKSVNFQIENLRFEISNLKFEIFNLKLPLAMFCALAMCASSRAGYIAPEDLSQLRVASLWPDFSAPQTPHPAVVRVIAPEGIAMSLGSGTLVDKNAEHGLVVTNWHVVRDAKGPVEVVFPGGFRATAKVIRMDRDWDLAALLIPKPPVEPVPLSTMAPKPGDALSIAGYGSGKYKMQSGRCTQYLSPGGNKPYEMIELSVAARQGDSGGPILNSRGELTGVLFGAGYGTTTGSYGGRVHQFLQLASNDLQRYPAANIAQTPAPSRERRDGAVQLYANNVDSPRAATFSGQITPPDSGILESANPKIASQAAPTTPAASIQAASPTSKPPSKSKSSANSWPAWAEELKSFLAAFGIAAILLQVFRSMTASKG